MKKSFFVIAALIIAMSLTGVVSALTFTDTNGHWASDNIEYLVEKKILDGYTDGTFKPDNTVTRAEFIKILDETFGLTETTSISFSDVASSDWYNVYISKAAAQGYLLSYGSALNPNGELSREEAAALLVRYLDLPAANKSSSSEYSDYSSITSTYRDYVLQSTYAKLFQGYPDGTFRPKNTLTRAEALAILYRAAGTIYDASKTGTDSKAQPGIGVITDGGITIKNATFSGNLIITEGASNGIININNCTINGELIIRGKAKVALSGCTVATLTQASKNTSSGISLASGTKIAALNLKTKATVSLASGTSVTQLTVDAQNSTVTGTGTVSNAKINAAGFISDQIPQKYEIASNYTATFNNSMYSGSSSAVATTNGFTVAPVVSNDTYYDCLSYTTAVTGTIFYYYTNTATQPTADQFTSAYSSNSISGSLTAEGGRSISESVQQLNVVRNYSYIVMMLRDASGKNYLPVVVTRSQTASSAAAGFSVAPSITTTAGYDYLGFTSIYTGTLYYYYATTAATPTTANFDASYQNAYYKGTMLVTGGSPTSYPTNIASQTVSGYPYVIVMLKTTASIAYQPIAVSKTGANSSGFTVQPTLQTISATDYITFTATASGTVTYYYSMAAAAPTTAVFDSTYINSLYKGQLFATAGQSTQNMLVQQSLVTSYPYLVVMFSDALGNKYQPLVITRGQTSGNGFTVAPAINSTTGYDYLSFTPATTGTLYYYYTTVATAPATSQEFFSANSVASVKSQLSVVSTSAVNSPLTNTSSVTAYTGVVVMLVSGTGTNYAPVLVSRNGSITGTGFSVAPSATLSGTNEYLSFTTTAAGTVYYYYTYSSITPTAANYFDQYNLVANKGQTQAAALTYSSQIVGNTSYTGYSYIAVMFIDSIGRKYQPVIVNRTGGLTSSGFTATPTLSLNGTAYMLTLTPYYTGIVSYYYTNEPIAPTAADFSSYYQHAILGTYGSYNVIANTQSSQVTIDSMTSSSYRYIVVMLTTADNTKYPPVIIAK